MEHHRKRSNKGMFDFSFVRRISGSSLCSYIRIFSRHFPDTFATGEQNGDDLDTSTIEPLEVVYASESGCKQGGDHSNDATVLSCTDSDTVAKEVQYITNDVDGAGQTNDLDNLGPVHSASSIKLESMQTIQLEDDNTDFLYDDIDHGEHDAIYFSRITSFYSALSSLDHSDGCPEDTAEQVTVGAKGAFKSNPASIGEQFDGKPSIDSDKTNASVCTDGNKGFGSVDLPDVDESGYFTEIKFRNNPSFCLKSEKSVQFDEESESYYSDGRKCFEYSSKERTDEQFVIDANIEQTAETVDVTNSVKLNQVRTAFVKRPIHFGKSLQTTGHFSNKEQKKTNSRSTSTAIQIQKPRSGIKNDIHRIALTDNGNSKMLTKSVRISPDLSDSRMSKRTVQDKIRSLFQREHPLEILFRQRKKMSQMSRQKRKASLLSLLNCASGRL